MATSDAVAVRVATLLAAMCVLSALALGGCPGDDAAPESDDDDEGAAGTRSTPLPALGAWRTLPRPPALPECVAGRCSHHSDCDDGLFCTGRELCDDDDESADACGCVRPMRSPCGSDVCDEVAGACWPAPARGPCASRCTSDDDCSDGLYCNGDERCRPSLAGADSCGCFHAAAPPCARDQTCNESEAACVATCDVELDNDGDGHVTPECGGDDCDDDDARRYPGKTEVCDSADRDEDCDPATFGFRDADGDGYGDAACCNDAVCGDDCDDGVSSVHPSEAESCDRRDNDCDGAVDEEVAMLVYSDEDGDGYGVGAALTACVGGADTSSRDGDCDDTNPAIFPGAMRCGAAADAIDVCALDGTWTADSCGMNAQAVPIPCIEQPNGTGHCFQEP